MLNSVPSPEHLQLLTNADLERETTACAERLRSAADASTSRRERALYHLLDVEWKHRGIACPESSGDTLAPV